MTSCWQRSDTRSFARIHLPADDKKYQTNDHGEQLTTSLLRQLQQLTEKSKFVKPMKIAEN